MFRRRLLQGIAFFLGGAAAFSKDGYVGKPAEGPLRRWGATQWEYSRLWIGYSKDHKDIVAEMNQLGSYGWELTACVDGYALFKRQIPTTINTPGLRD